MCRTTYNTLTTKWIGLHNGRINLFKESLGQKTITWELLMIRIIIIMIISLKPHNSIIWIIIRCLLKIRVELTLLKKEALTHRDSKVQTKYLSKHKIRHFRTTTNTTALFRQVNSHKSQFFIKISLILQLIILIPRPIGLLMILMMTLFLFRFKTLNPGIL